MIASPGLPDEWPFRVLCVVARAEAVGRVEKLQAELASQAEQHEAMLGFNLASQLVHLEQNNFSSYYSPELQAQALQPPYLAL